MMAEKSYEDIARENEALQQANDDLLNRLISAQAEAARWRDEAAILRRRINQPNPRDPSAKSAFERPFR